MADPPLPAPRAARVADYLDLIRWNRPAGSYLLLWPTLSALWIAAHGFPGWHLLAVFDRSASYAAVIVGCVALAAIATVAAARLARPAAPGY